MSSSNLVTISIQTIVHAPLKSVWKFWNEPEHIKGWNFASEDWHCPVAKNDLKIGGTLQTRMEAADGSMGFDFIGTYEEIKPLSKIVYKIEDGRKVMIQFSEKNSATTIQESFEAESSYDIEMQKNGWQAILNNFKKYVEQQS